MSQPELLHIVGQLMQLRVVDSENYFFFIDLRQRSIGLLFHLSVHSLVDSSRVVVLYMSFCVERNIFREFLSPFFSF